MKDQQKAHPQAASQSAATSRSELIFGDSTGDISADLSEDQVLGLLHQSGLNAALLASIARTPMAAKSRKVSIALLRHQRLPRHLSIALLRRLFTFDLVKVALSPVIAPDLKRIAEEQILLRLESLPLGERISLARRSPPRVLEGLLADGDGRVLSAALANSRLRESSLVAVLRRGQAPAILFESVSRHSTWSERREVQIALLGSEKTPIAWAKRFAMRFPPQILEDIMPQSRRYLAGMDRSLPPHDL